MRKENTSPRQFGISIPGQPTLHPLVGPNPWILPGLKENDGFRSNLIMAGASPEASTVAFSVISNGVLIGSGTRDIPPYGLVQVNRVARAVGGTTVDDGYIHLEIESGGVVVGMSVVEASADDAAYVVARPMFP